MNTAMERILTDKDWFNFILNSFFAGSTNVKDYSKNNRLPYYLNCRFKLPDLDDYLKCTNYRTCKIFFILGDYTEYINKFLETLSGKWYIKYHDEDKHKNLGFLSDLLENTIYK